MKLDTIYIIIYINIYIYIAYLYKPAAVTGCTDLRAVSDSLNTQKQPMSASLESRRSTSTYIFSLVQASGTVHELPITAQTATCTLAL